MRKRRAAMAALTFLAVGSSGCGGPRLIQAYTVRPGQMVFAVQEGTKYSLGECKRAPDGNLSGCELHQVEFE